MFSVDKIYTGKEDCISMKKYQQLKSYDIVVHEVSIDRASYYIY
jgi:hypothetical protein